MSFLDAVTGLFADRASKADPAETERQQAAQHTVLVIDDDKDYLEWCGEILRTAGYNVLKSTTGSKGLNMLRYAPKDIHAILLDYDMPQFDGADTLKFIRKMSPQLKVAAVTGLDANLLPAGFRENVDQTLLKPFTSEQLLQFIRELLHASPRAIESVSAGAPAPAAAGA